MKLDVNDMLVQLLTYGRAEQEDCLSLVQENHIMHIP